MPSSYLDNVISWVTFWFPPSDLLMWSNLVISSLDHFSPGTQRMLWLILREWMWHHKSYGDSRATDRRGQSCAHRKCIPSPHSHCPHWCLFKLSFDTWRDYSSTENLLHPRLQCSKSTPLFSVTGGQTGTLSPWRLSTSYRPHPILLWLWLTDVTYFTSGIKKLAAD